MTLEDDIKAALEKIKGVLKKENVVFDISKFSHKIQEAYDQALKGKETTGYIIGDITEDSVVVKDIVFSDEEIPGAIGTFECKPGAEPIKRELEPSIKNIIEKIKSGEQARQMGIGRYLLSGFPAYLLYEKFDKETIRNLWKWINELSGNIQLLDFVKSKNKWIILATSATGTKSADALNEIFFKYGATFGMAAGEAVAIIAFDYDTKEVIGGLTFSIAHEFKEFYGEEYRDLPYPHADVARIAVAVTGMGLGPIIYQAFEKLIRTSTIRTITVSEVRSEASGKLFSRAGFKPLNIEKGTMYKILK